MKVRKKWNKEEKISKVFMVKGTFWFKADVKKNRLCEEETRKRKIMDWKKDFKSLRYLKEKLEIFVSMTDLH